jgi:hypothetical protein
MRVLRRIRPGGVPARSAGKEQRTTLRFDVHGGLDGHLVTTNRPMAIKNLGLGGFAADVAIPVAAGSHLVRFTTSDRTATLLETRSVYCRPIREPGVARRYAAGFEFVRPPQDVDRAVKVILQQVTQLRLGLRWV